MEQNHPSQKPVILLNIDSLMPGSLEVAAQTGRAPALKYLMEKGNYISNMVTAFPTMSVTIDSTLLTGTYPDKHQVPGLTWFDTSEKKIINYGTGFRETFRLGMRRSVHNMLYRLNHEHLSGDVSTIYEVLANKGISSASINSFVYRGNTAHQLKVPRLFSTLTKFEDGQWTAEATPVFSLGIFSKLRSRGFPTQIAAGNYKYTARELKSLIRKKNLPAFTFCIFQDMDARIHFKGPLDIKGIIKIDREIQKILNLYPSWEDAIKRNVWLVIGDNGHAATGRKYRDVVIDLRKKLIKYRIARIERPVQNKDQLLFSVNQRMAYIYILDKDISQSAVVKQLKQDKRIDIIAWKNEGEVHIASGVREGTLQFRPGGKYVDEYEQTWNLHGDLELLELNLVHEKVLLYGDYPDALARIHAALYSHSGRFIIVNAKPGYEFKAQSTPFHLAGAAHGSLHKQESLVPLIIAGTTEKPNFPRFVDMKEYILRLIQQQE